MPIASGTKTGSLHVPVGSSVETITWPASKSLTLVVMNQNRPPWNRSVDP
jgi:hypothetical protein